MNEKEKTEGESTGVPLTEKKDTSSLGRFDECTETNGNHKGLEETPVSAIDLVKMCRDLQQGRNMYGKNSGVMVEKKTSLY